MKERSRRRRTALWLLVLGGGTALGAEAPGTRASGTHFPAGRLEARATRLAVSAGNPSPTIIIRTDAATDASPPVTQTVVVSSNMQPLPTATGSSANVAVNLTNSPPPPSYAVPSPFDSTLGVNFVSTACPSFIQTFIADPTTIACAALSLLLSTSEGFFASEKSPYSKLAFNLDAGCNASQSQCSAHFAQLATSIQLPGNCGKDLMNNNALASQALIGFRNYDMMRAAGCLRDPTTSNYCLSDAVAQADPSALYFYQLPFGIGLPSGVKTKCTNCTANTLKIFSTFALDPSLLISKTYAPAQSLASLSCGPTFAPVVAVISSNLASPSTAPTLFTISLILSLCLSVLFR